MLVIHAIRRLITRAFDLPLLRLLRPAVSRAKTRVMAHLIMRQWRDTDDPEVKEVLDFVRARPDINLPMCTRPPYAFVDEYDADAIKVLWESEQSLPCVMVDGHKVYFPKGFAEPRIKRIVTTALVEQDSRCPHAYLDSGFDIDEGDTAVFAGASDGIFCLSRICKLRKAYLFEPDPRWHESLKLTFSQFADKVIVMPYFLGNTSGGTWVTLDDFAQQIAEPIHFLQADVEGDEIAVLEGAKRTLSRATKMRVSICSYHRPSHPAEIRQILENNGFAVSYSHGYFIQTYDPPYLQRAVVRGCKSC